MSEGAIVLEGLTCKVGRFQLGPLDFIAPRGSVTAFVGPNGAGKTTTLDLIMGMGRPSGGAIRVLGLSQPRDEVRIKARTAYVSPDLNYMAWGKVGRALDFVSGFYPDWDDERCERLLEQFELSRGDRISNLSFGARIKLSIVMALARDAELLLLDEPTVGLDVNARLLLFSQILAFVKREEKAVVISSHQLTDLERLADQIVILDQGKVAAAGAMDELLERYTRLDANLTMGGALPRIDGIKLLGREGDRVRLLIDRAAMDPAALQAHGLQTVQETPLTLEELFVALTNPAEA
jgi:ABC-2 type transport system ATP-binding protein